MKDTTKQAIPIVLIVILIILYYGFNITPISYQYRLSNHKNIGKEITFSQPIGFTIRNNPAIVPIVDEIQNELGSLHPYNSDYDKVNQYLAYNTIFTITAIYAYADIINSKKLYYILSDKKGQKYIIGEWYFNILQKPVYPNAKVPIAALDELYFEKKNIKMKFIALNEHNRYLKSEYFDRCKVNGFTIKYMKRKAIATATVDFSKLVCLYDYFWRDSHSEINPISFEVIE